MSESGDVPRAGLAVVDALRNRAVNTANCLDERLLRRTGITGLDSRADALHACPYIGANVAISRGALDRLASSLFC